MVWADVSLDVLDAVMLQPADKRFGSLRPIALTLPWNTDHPRDLGSALIVPCDRRLNRPDRDPVGPTARDPVHPDLVGQSGTGFKAAVSGPEPVERTGRSSDVLVEGDVVQDPEHLLGVSYAERRKSKARGLDTRERLSAVPGLVAATCSLCRRAVASATASKAR